MVGPGFGRYAAMMFSIQPNRVKLPFQRTGFGRREIDFAGGFIQTGYALDLPIAFGQLTEWLALIGIQVEVMKAIALTTPQETFAVIQEAQVVVHVDPVRVFLMEHDPSG